MAAGQVYELQHALVEFACHLGPDDPAAIKAGSRMVLARFPEPGARWAALTGLLVKRAYVLAEYPQLLRQELLNALDFPALIQFGEQLPAESPALVVRRREASEFGVSRLVCQSKSCPEVTALACDPAGRLCIVQHGRRIGVWNLGTLNGQVSEGTEVRHIAASPTTTEFYAATEASFWIQNGPGDLHTFPWPDSARAVLAVTSCAVGFCALLAEAEGVTDDAATVSVVRYYAAGQAPGRVLARVTDGPCTGLAAPARESWLALHLNDDEALSGEERGWSVLRTLDTVTGAVLASVTLDERTYWIGAAPDGRLLLSAHKDEIRFWGAPDLRLLGAVPREYAAMWMTVFHPTRPLALLFSRYDVRVLDLNARRIIMSDRFRGCELAPIHAPHDGVPEEAAVLAGGVGFVAVLDVARSRVVRCYRVPNAAVERLERTDAGVRVFWTLCDPTGADDAELYDFERERNDAAVAESLGLEVPLRHVAWPDPSDDVPLAALPWRDDEIGPHNKRIAVSGFDVVSGKLRNFVELPPKDADDALLSLPGSDCVVYTTACECYLLVAQASSGEVLIESYDAHVLIVMDDRRLLCCDDDGGTFILHLPSGEITSCGVELGLLRHTQSGAEHALSPDERLLAWNTADAIIVSELKSGAEVARYPIHQWTGTLAFDGPDTITASGSPERVVLQLVSERS
jgi:hypothetical protein